MEMPDNNSRQNLILCILSTFFAHPLTRSIINQNRRKSHHYILPSSTETWYLYDLWFQLENWTLTADLCVTSRQRSTAQTTRTPLEPFRVSCSTQINGQMKAFHLHKFSNIGEILTFQYKLAAKHKRFNISSIQYFMWVYKKK